MKTAHDLGITAKMYLVGACAAPAIADQIGEDAVAGPHLQRRGTADHRRRREAAIYAAALAKYGDPSCPSPAPARSASATS